MILGDETPDIALTRPAQQSGVDGGPALLLYNSKSRRGLEALPAILEALEARGIPVAAHHRMSRKLPLEEVVREAISGGVRRVLVGGGDGTLNIVVKHLLGRDVTLGVLPLGTGNDFARSLGIEPTLEAACDVIASGYTARVDVGLANGHPFLNAVCLGMASAIAKRMSPELKRRVGKLAYPVAALAELWDHQPFHVRLVSNGETLEVNALHLVVGNGRYHGAGNMVAPDATLDDHRLDAYAVVAPSVGSEREGTNLGHMHDLSTLARVSLSVRKGEHVNHPAVTTVSGTSLYLEAHPPQDVNADGEFIGQTPVRFEISSSALRVYAHAPAPTQH